MARVSPGAAAEAHGGRLGFRLEKSAKRLIERAARLEGRSLTDFCLAALTEKARSIVAEREALALSERDREAFFRALVQPPRVNARLRHALRSERRRIAP
jgi:uncharacterized protein (DUF1778 family)